jgi:hypothetical protein
MSNTVRFRVRLTDGSWADEDELSETAADLRDEEVIDGALHVAVDGGDDVVVADDLGALAQNVCLGAVADLAAERSAAVRHYDKPGYFRLDPEGWFVRLSGDYVPEVVVPRVELVDSLLACAERIAAFMRLLGTRDAQAADLEERAARARAAVEAGVREWPGPPPAVRP